MSPSAYQRPPHVYGEILSASVYQSPRSALPGIGRFLFDRQEFTFSVIAVSHFALAVVLVFARIPFWLLLPLAIIVNFPIVVFLSDALPKVEGVRVLTLIYLHLWAAFLLCRFSLPQRPFSFLKKEARYYLID